MIFRAKVYAYDYMESQWLLCCSQTPQLYQNEQRLFVTNKFIPYIPLEQAIFPRGRAAHKRQFVVHLDNCSIHASRVSTYWLDEYSILRMPHPPYSPNLATSDFYFFPTVKEKLERIQLADEDQFFECL
jgi:hypothetical protein